MSRRCVLSLLVIIGFVSFVPSASASASASADSTLHVAQANSRCTDTGTGTASQPLCTIGAAALRVVQGQTVHVAAGTYRERVAIHTSGTQRAPITFIAEPGGKVSLTGGSNGFYVSNASWVTLAGFTIDGTTGYGISVINAAHVTVSRNRISRSGKRQPGALAAGIYLRDVSDSLVSKNTSFANSYAGILLTFGATRNVVRENVTHDNVSGYDRRAPGIRLYEAPDNTVTANVSYDNEDSGIEMYPGSTGALVSNNVVYGNGDHGIDVFRAPGARILANTVHGNRTAGINIEGGSGHSLIANNIAVDNGVASPRSKGNIRVDVDSVDGTTMNFDLVYLSTPPETANLPTSPETANPSYLVVWAGTGFVALHDLTVATGQENRGIWANPDWVNPAAGNYRLTSRSPGIDSADSNAPGQPGRDMVGHGRVDTRRAPNTGAGRVPFVDRGAFEFVGGKAK